MKEIDKLNFRPFTRFCMSIGAVPSSYLAGLTIEEQLLWLCSYLEKEVIPAVNNNAEAVEELQGLFIELKSYVDNYFDNLDVQEEINNKLDDMAESGQLEEIIASYLQTRAVFGFDTVADMKDGENLIAGSYARTLGYYSINDEGGALYHIRNITNDDVIDEMFIIEMNDSQNQLIAELIPENNQVSLKQLGLLGDGTTDETTKLQKAFASEYNILVNSGVYVTNERVTINSPKIIKGEEGATLKAKQNMSIYTNIMYVNSNDVEITNLIFDGNITQNPIGDVYNASQGYILLELHNTSNLVVKNCTFKDNAYGAVRLGGTYSNETDVKNIIVAENYFKNVDCGFITMASNSNMNLIDTKIINNIFDGHNYSEPISIYHTGKTENLLIDNNIMKNKYSGHAILVKNGTPKNIIVTNNEISQCASGLECHNVVNLNVSNNTIIGTSSHPINTGIGIIDCQHFTVNNNIIDYVSFMGINLKTSNYGDTINNKIYNLNCNSAATGITGIMIDNDNNIYLHNNYVKRYESTLTQVYYLKGTLTYLTIDEMTNTSDVEVGMQTQEIASLTNANIRTNLSMNGNFTSANLSSDTNRITQYNPTLLQGLNLPYRFRFAKDLPMQLNSNLTFSTFTIYNLLDNDVYTFNIRVIGGATITLTSDTTSDFGITWKTDRSITTPTQLKLMYYNGKFYEI